jgi:tripartite-type tricarboxylate transporter receptor subunit TctC
MLLQVVAVLAAAVPIGLMPVSGALAQTDAYPSKFIRWVLPFSAGSGQDILARQVSPRLSERLGQPVVVDNKAGAGGIIGFEYIAKAAPDGHQIMMGNNSLLILSAIRPTPYDPLRDFAPVMQMGVGHQFLMVHASLPVRSVAELVTLSKAQPGKLNYSSPAVGTFGHLGTELFKMQTGADLVHIPHKGIVAAVQGLVAGDVGFVIAGPDLAAPHVRAGKVRMLAVAGVRRSPLYPDIPTTYELGYKEYDTSLWYGLLVPAGTRSTIIARLNAEMSRILAEPSAREEALKRGVELLTSTPEQFGSLMRNELATWQKVIKAGNIRPD